MPRGQPDFGVYASKDITGSLSDLGEAVARLDSIVTYDRRGEVVNLDNFEEPVLKWLEVLGAGSARLHNVDAKSGSQSVALSTDAADNAWVTIRRYLNITPSKRLGIEFSFGSVLEGELTCEIYFFDGGRVFKPWITIDLDNHLLYIYDGDLAADILVADFGRLEYGLGRHLFQTIKLVCDFDTKKYVRILLGSREWDISTVSLKETASDIAPQIRIEITRSNMEAGAVITSIDDFIFTQAEP